jgi:hypothetical protein
LCMRARRKATRSRERLRSESIAGVLVLETVVDAKCTEEKSEYPL